MSPNVDQLFQAALDLTDEEILQLVDALVVAIDERGLRLIDDSWIEEVRRRSAEYNSGAVQPIPWAEVKRRARVRVSSLDRRRQGITAGAPDATINAKAPDGPRPSPA